MKKIIPFDINQYTDKNVFTKSGNPVRIICTDRKQSNYCIVALIERDGDEELKAFTINGKYSTGSNSENDLFLYIDAEFEPFQKVLARDYDDEMWHPHFYSNKKDNKYRMTNGWSYKQCIPYEGNEHLYNTNKSPK